MIEGFVGNVLSLLATASFMIVASLVLRQMNIFKTRSENKTGQLIIIAIVFGLLAIYGSLMGIETGGAILNVRELSPLMAGLVGGPIAGFLAGLIGGVHRYWLGGFTGLPCSISTIVAGVVSGIVATRITGKSFLLKGALLAFVFESGAMALVLLLSQPFSRAAQLVGQIAPPMITAVTLGFATFLYLLNSKR